MSSKDLLLLVEDVRYFFMEVEELFLLVVLHGLLHHSYVISRFLLVVADQFHLDVLLNLLLRLLFRGIFAGLLRHAFVHGFFFVQGTVALLKLWLWFLQVFCGWSNQLIIAFVHAVLVIIVRFADRNLRLLRLRWLLLRLRILLLDIVRRIHFLDGFLHTFASSLDIFHFS